MCKQMCVYVHAESPRLRPCLPCCSSPCILRQGLSLNSKLALPANLANHLAGFSLPLLLPWDHRRSRHPHRITVTPVDLSAWQALNPPSLLSSPSSYLYNFDCHTSSQEGHMSCVISDSLWSIPPHSCQHWILPH